MEEDTFKELKWKDRNMNNLRYVDDLFILENLKQILAQLEAKTEKKYRKQYELIDKCK